MHALRSKSFAATAFVTLGGVLAALAAGSPASADSLPAATCVTACTAVFDTAGSGQTFTLPVGVSELTATIAGAAGSPASFAITNDPTAAGGPGGAAVLALGTAFAGTTVSFGVGAAGEGSYLVDSDNTLLAIAGGGGGGGYVGRLDLEGQIFGTFPSSLTGPGSQGGSPTAGGVTPGSTGDAFGALPANGTGGGLVAGGSGGTGTLANGTAGGDTSVVSGSIITLAAGGIGGTYTTPGTTHVGGAGGTGYTGGGGGGVQSVDSGDDIFVEVVAPGGGGSAYLDASLSAAAAVVNTGSGYLTFTWSYAPVIASPSAGGSASFLRGARIPVTVSGLPTNAPYALAFDGVTVATGTTDVDGTAATTFLIADTQRAGSFAVELVMGGATVASTAMIAVSVPAVVPIADPIVPPADAAAAEPTPVALAATGVTTGGTASAALIVLGLGALLLLARRLPRLR